MALRPVNFEGLSYTKSLRFGTDMIVKDRNYGVLLKSYSYSTPQFFSYGARMYFEVGVPIRQSEVRQSELLNLPSEFTRAKLQV